MPPKADDTTTTDTADLPVTIDLDVEFGVHVRHLCAVLAKLDYEARVRVLAWLARRFDVDTDALRGSNAAMTTSALMALVCIGTVGIYSALAVVAVRWFLNKNGATLAFRTFMAPLLKNGEEI